MKKFTFVFFLATSNIGGTELTVLKLMQHFKCTNLDFLVITLTPPGPLYSKFINQKLPVQSLEFCNIWHTIKSFSLLKDLIIEHNIIGMYVFGMIPHIFALFSKYIKLTKFVISGQRGDLREKGVKLLIRKILANLCDNIVFNSSKVHSDAISKFGFSKNKSIVIKNGINIPDYLLLYQTNELAWPKIVSHFNINDVNSQSVQYIVGTVANLRNEKDYPTFIKAASIIIKQRKDIRFISIGTGDLKASLYELVCELNLAEYFHFLGYQENILDLVKLLDIFVLTSLTESSPNAIIEAMSLGKPVVATAVGGVTEVITHRKSGILISPSDYTTLSEVILELLDSPSLRSDLGIKAKEKVLTEHNFETFIQKTKQLIHFHLESQNKSGKSC
jgi:glycosyltransferase involved in cell wall biosynthesis